MRKTRGNRSEKKKSLPRLKNLKLKLGKALGRGSSAITFTQKGIGVIQNRKERLNSAKTVRNLLADKENYRVTPKKRRLYKIFRVKKRSAKSCVKLERDPKRQRYLELRKRLEIKDRYSDTASLKYMLKRKNLTEKDLHMKRLRALRACLKDNRESISKALYRKLYRRIKGNYFTGSPQNAVINLKRAFNIS